MRVYRGFESHPLRQLQALPFSRMLFDDACGIRTHGIETAVRQNGAAVLNGRRPARRASPKGARHLTLSASYRPCRSAGCCSRARAGFEPTVSNIVVRQNGTAVLNGRRPARRASPQRGASSHLLRQLRASVVLSPWRNNVNCVTLQKTSLLVVVCADVARLINALNPVCSSVDFSGRQDSSHD